MHIMHSHNRFILHLNKSLWIKDGGEHSQPRSGQNKVKANF